MSKFVEEIFLKILRKQDKIANILINQKSFKLIKKFTGKFLPKNNQKTNFNNGDDRYREKKIIKSKNRLYI